MVTVMPKGEEVNLNDRVRPGDMCLNPFGESVHEDDRSLVHL